MGLIFLREAPQKRRQHWLNGVFRRSFHRLAVTAERTMAAPAKTKVKKSITSDGENEALLSRSSQHTAPYLTKLANTFSHHGCRQPLHARDASLSKSHHCAAQPFHASFHLPHVLVQHSRVRTVYLHETCIHMFVCNARDKSGALVPSRTNDAQHCKTGPPIQYLSLQQLRSTADVSGQNGAS